MTRWLVIGLIVGVGIGWAGAVLTADPPAPSHRDTREPEGAGGSTPTLAGAAEEPVRLTEAPRAADLGRLDWRRLLTEGATEDINAALNDAGRTGDEGDLVFTDALVRRLVERAEDAWKRRSKRDLMVFIRALGMADSKLGDEFLKRLADDADTPLPHPFGSSLGRALEDSEVTGLAESARRRFGQMLEEGGDSWTAAAGWFELVAAHGGREDLTWLLERNESSQIRHRAVRALAKVRQGEGLAFVLDLLRTATGTARVQRVLPEIARGHPEEVFEILDDRLRRADGGEETLYGMTHSRFMKAYGGAVTPASLDDAGRTLLGLRNPHLRLASVYAVHVMANKQMDVGRLEPLLRAPMELLEARAAEGSYSGGDRPSVQRAVYAIEYNRVTWLPGTPGQLEALAERFPPRAEKMREVAAEIRTHLRSPWKDE